MATESIGLRQRILDSLGEPLAVAWRVLATLPVAWLVGVYGLFFLTALVFGEWPHPPGLYHDTEHLAADPDGPFAGYCAGTFDPKGYGALVDLLYLGIPVCTVIALVWLPFGMLVLAIQRRLPRVQNVALGLGLAGMALTMYVDPIGAWDWFID